MKQYAYYSNLIDIYIWFSYSSWIVRSLDSCVNAYANMNAIGDDLIAFIKIFQPDKEEIRIYKTEELIELLEAKVNEVSN